MNKPEKVPKDENEYQLSCPDLTGFHDYDQRLSLEPMTGFNETDDRSCRRQLRDSISCSSVHETFRSIEFLDTRLQCLHSIPKTFLPV